MRTALPTGSPTFFLIQPRILLWVACSRVDLGAVHEWIWGQVGATPPQPRGFAPASDLLTSVENAYGVAHWFSDILLDPAADALVGCLRLVRGRRLAGSNRPDWFIGNDHSVPVFRILDVTCQQTEGPVTNPSSSSSASNIQGPF